MQLLRSREPAVFAGWHQDFVHTLGYISRWNPRRKTYVLASASRDGTLAAVAAECIGFRKPVRGSSAKHAGKALLQLTRLMRADRRASVTVVCDGPRPPARTLKPGILHLSQASGHPIWLLRTSFRRRWILEKTWARFHWPKPLSRGVCLADGPIHVPPDLDREAFERLRVEVEQRLNALAERADAMAARQ